MKPSSTSNLDGFHSPVFPRVFPFFTGTGFTRYGSSSNNFNDVSEIHQIKNIDYRNSTV